MENSGKFDATMSSWLRTKAINWRVNAKEKIYIYTCKDDHCSSIQKHNYYDISGRPSPLSSAHSTGSGCHSGLTWVILRNSPCWDTYYIVGTVESCWETSVKSQESYFSSYWEWNTESVDWVCSTIGGLKLGSGWLKDAVGSD